ncbi:hypothetical protein [Chitinophaga rhizophila]|uniref:Uncharacterized protein n=1 Tax=Chitinophaga rhizophila TaxID=2866212 RepID=A0ABS7G6F4_9BACT|nr:hypothetical protein [Chitinophaga rhizophila]MBW8682951.1 hypothetical protein [Chitinophaga rhizophila]
MIRMYLISPTGAAPPPDISPPRENQFPTLKDPPRSRLRTIITFIIYLFFACFFSANAALYDSPFYLTLLPLTYVPPVCTINNIPACNNYLTSTPSYIQHPVTNICPERTAACLKTRHYRHAGMPLSADMPPPILYSDTPLYHKMKAT